MKTINKEFLFNYIFFFSKKKNYKNLDILLSIYYITSYLTVQMSTMCMYRKCMITIVSYWKSRKLRARSTLLLVYIIETFKQKKKQVSIPTYLSSSVINRDSNNVTTCTSWMLMILFTNHFTTYIHSVFYVLVFQFDGY